nr:gamma-glutamylcyclotransferase [uncultured Pseudomonas sp.]
MRTQEALTHGIARDDLSGSALREAIVRTTGSHDIPTDAELDASRSAWFAGLLPDEELWIFAYGSLVWNPTFPVAEQRRARLFGFHRSFCMSSTIDRGTKERPGLMLALDGGGAVNGIVLKMALLDREEEIRLLWRREMLSMSYRPLWVTVHTEDETIKALTFIADTQATNYIGYLPLLDSANKIAGASGLLGTNLEYLDSTYHALTERGIEDRYLRELLALCGQNRE